MALQPGFGGEVDDAEVAVAKLMMPKWRWRRRCCRCGRDGEDDAVDVVAAVKMTLPVQ